MKHHTLTTMLAISLLTAGAVIAAEDISFSASSIDFAASDSAAVVTVAGPEGFYYRQELDAGSVASMSLFDASGNPLVDGTYNWQLIQVKAKAKSGVFTIEGGSVVNPLALEDAKAQAFTDPMHLQENNLRIKLQDTSSSASFPTNDWQLTVNDSFNGGANKFSIDDVDGGKTPFTLEAGAPSHSLYIDDGGKVGIGTSAPAVALQVVSGDTPTVRLEQNNSLGLTPQNWDIAGNDDNFFISDATNGSTLPLRIETSAPSNAIYVDSTGNIGLGTTSPDSNLDIEGPIAELRLSSTNAGEAWELRVNNAGRLNFQAQGTTNNALQLDADADDSLLRVGTMASSLVDINGDLSVTGDLVITGTCTGCDAIFQPNLPLASIEEHADSMWKNSYLPGVGPTAEGATVINVFEKTTGILQELEIAHIYIEQLHTSIKSLQKRLDELETTTP